MSNPRDLRDPTALGEALLSAWEPWRPTDKSFSWVADRATLRVPDYVSPLHPHDRYGDPRCIPSTLPN